jgi:thiamine biosynthesis lipoprotein
MPSPDEIADARSKTGMHLVQLDEKNSTVRFARDGVMLDLGAIGKGFAIERAAELLREAGVVSALLHGGTSTVYGLGHPPDSDSWKVAVESPIQPEQTQTNPALPAFSLHDEAMSVSAIWGRSFEKDGKILGHVLDPRTGQPVTRALLAAVVLPSATETDALSTALLVTGANDAISNLRPNMRTLLVTNTAGKPLLTGTALS